jgi:hypothetical protein
MTIFPGEQALAHDVSEISPPQGRLTVDPIRLDPWLATQDALAQTYINYVPNGGFTIPLIDPTGYVFTRRPISEISLSLAPYVLGEILDIFVYWNSTVTALAALSWGTAAACLGMAITDATNANPIVITAAGHGLTTGARAYINGVQGNTAANGESTITYIDANTFSINSIGNGAYTSGGWLTARSATNWAGQYWPSLKWGYEYAYRSGSLFRNLPTKDESIYVGTIKMSAVGQTEDSMTKRFVWNAFNQIPKPLAKFDATASWSYGTGAWRQANAAAANQVAWVTGAGGMICCDVDTAVTLASNVAQSAAVSMGLCGVSGPASPFVTTGRGRNAGSSEIDLQLHSALRVPFSGGYGYATWLEYGASAGTCTFIGGNVRGITGYVMA